MANGTGTSARSTEVHTREYSKENALTQFSFFSVLGLHHQAELHCEGVRLVPYDSCVKWCGRGIVFTKKKFTWGVDVETNLVINDLVRMCYIWFLSIIFSMLLSFLNFFMTCIVRRLQGYVYVKYVI